MLKRFSIVHIFNFHNLSSKAFFNLNAIWQIWCKGFWLDPLGVQLTWCAAQACDGRCAEEEQSSTSQPPAPWPLHPPVRNHRGCWLGQEKNTIKRKSFYFSLDRSLHYCWTSWGIGNTILTGKKYSFTCWMYKTAMYYFSIISRMQCASVSSSIGLPVISFQVNWSGCLHQQVLHIPPCQQKATENTLLMSFRLRLHSACWHNHTQNVFIMGLISS